MMETMNRLEFLKMVGAERIPAQFPEDVKDAIEKLFPNVDPGVLPFGQRVLVQLRLPRNKSKGGIKLVAETTDTERWNEPVAQVVAVGPLAFKKRDSLEPWGEGIWADVGDYVRVPRFGGDRWEVPTTDLDGIDELEKRKTVLQGEIDDIMAYGAEPLSDRAREKVARLKAELKGLGDNPPQIMVMFAQFNDFELIGKLTGSPIDMKVYV